MVVQFFLIESASLELLNFLMAFVKRCKITLLTRFFLLLSFFFIVSLLGSNALAVYSILYLHFADRFNEARVDQSG